MSWGLGICLLSSLPEYRLLSPGKASVLRAESDKHRLKPSAWQSPLIGSMAGGGIKHGLQLLPSSVTQRLGGPITSRPSSIDETPLSLPSFRPWKGDSLRVLLIKHPARFRTVSAQTPRECRFCLIRETQLKDFRSRGLILPAGKNHEMILIAGF